LAHDLHAARPPARSATDGRLPRAGPADVERLPVKPPKKAKPHRHGLAHWIEEDGRIWLVRRPDKGMLGGMRALPGGDWADAPPAESGIVRVDHGFTHFDLTLALVRREAPMPQRKANGGRSRTLTRPGCRRSIAN
jgi:adenine-specific DNA glycosylase